MGLRRLVPDYTVVDTRRTRQPSRFEPERLRRSFAEPVRKVPLDGFKEPFSLLPMSSELVLLASEYMFDFVIEELSRAAPEPNGTISTDLIASAALAGLHRMHILAFLRSSVHHRMIRLEARESEIAELATQAAYLVSRAHSHTERQEFTWPALREPPLPVLCPRCGTARIARRSRSSSAGGLEQQPASCGHCGQRYILEWGSESPLLVMSAQDASLFDATRFRAGIRNAVRKLPGSAAIWSDEKLVISAAHAAAVSAIPYIRPPTPEHPMPAIQGRDLWLAAAAALKDIHPLAFVRYALHSGAVDELPWQERDFARAITRMEDVVSGIGIRYFESKRFPDPPAGGR